MKRRIVCAICILAFLLCGCVPTPEEEYVVNKGDDKAGAEIESTTAPSEPIVQPVFPEHWKDNVTTDIAEVVIDADIVSSDLETYPVYLVGRHSFTREEVVRVANAFFTDMTGVQQGNGMTREEYEAALKSITDKEFEEETRLLQMQYLQEVMNSCSATEEGFSDVSELTVSDIPSGLSSRLIIRQADGRSGNLWFNQSELAMGKSSISPVQPKSWIDDGGGYIGEKDAVIEASITIEQAISEAEAFFEKIGAEGFELAESEEARYFNMYDLSVMSMGWQLQYTRSFGYCPVNASAHAVSEQKIAASSDVSFSRSWNIEWIDIYVSEYGVEYFNWHNPLNDLGVANENVKLMDFEDLSGIIKRYFSAKFGDPDAFVCGYNSIDKMTLTVLPTSKKDSQDAYMMPVWICEIGLYFSLDAENPYSGFMQPGRHELQNKETIAFNAIDGAIVIVPRSQ